MQGSEVTQVLNALTDSARVLVWQFVRFCLPVIAVIWGADLLLLLRKIRKKKKEKQDDEEKH